MTLFYEMGFHLDETIKSIMFAFDPEAIMNGGSVSKTFSFFEKSIQKSLSDFQFKEVIKSRTINIEQGALFVAYSLGLK